MNYKQLSLGFMEELDKRELDLHPAHVTKEIPKRTRQQLKELHSVRQSLSSNDLEWCFRISEFAKRNKRLSEKQVNVVNQIFMRQSLSIADAS